MEDIKLLELQKQNLQSNVAYLQKEFSRLQFDYNTLTVNYDNLIKAKQDILAQIENLKTETNANSLVLSNLIKEINSIKKNKEMLSIDFDTDKAEFDLKKNILIRDCKDEQERLNILISQSKDFIKQGETLKQQRISQIEQGLILDNKIRFLEATLDSLVKEKLQLDRLNNEAKTENLKLFELKESLQSQKVTNEQIKADLLDKIKELNEQKSFLESKAIRLQDEIKLRESRNEILQTEYVRLKDLQSEALLKITDSERILKEVDYKNTLLHKKILEIVRVANENGYKITNQEIEKLIAW